MFTIDGYWSTIQKVCMCVDVRVFHRARGLVFQFIELIFDVISYGVQMISNIVQTVLLQVAILIDYAKVNGSTDNSRDHQNNAQHRHEHLNCTSAATANKIEKEKRKIISFCWCHSCRLFLSCIKKIAKKHVTDL